MLMKDFVALLESTAAAIDIIADKYDGRKFWSPEILRYEAEYLRDNSRDGETV